LPFVSRLETIVAEEQQLFRKSLSGLDKQEEN